MITQQPIPIEFDFWIDLQWFAAEDEGRTEDPTDYKIRKAREEGRVAKSQDINAALVLLFPASALIFLSSFFLDDCMEILRFFFLRSTQGDIRSGIWFGIFVQTSFKITDFCFQLSRFSLNLIRLYRILSVFLNVHSFRQKGSLTLQNP